MSFEIEWIKSNAVVRFYDQLTFQDFRQVNDLIYGDPRFDNMEYQIADFTDVSSIQLTNNQVKVLSTLEKGASRWNESVKVAHVTRDTYLQNLVHAYERDMQQTNWSCKLFDNLTDAQTWCTE